MHQKSIPVVFAYFIFADTESYTCGSNFFLVLDLPTYISGPRNQNQATVAYFLQSKSKKTEESLAQALSKKETLGRR